MNKIQLNITLMFSLLFSFAQSYANEKMMMTEIMYQEASPGLGSYPYRILTNEDYIRFDGGLDEDGYILLDRKKQQIFSVNHNDRSRFLIQPKSKGQYSNDKINVDVVHSELNDSPTIQGVKGKMHEIIANENLCRQVLSFAGLLPDATLAWKEYEDILQQQNQLTLSRTPKDMQTDCFITNNITHASRYLDFGLPFSIKSKDGTLRVLKNFQQVEKPKALMSVPKSYRQFEL